MRLWIASLKYHFLTITACTALVGTLSTTVLADGMLAPGFAAAARNLVAILHERSPGHRVGGELADTKPLRRHPAARRTLAHSRRPIAHPAMVLAVPPSGPVEIPGLYPPAVALAIPAFTETPFPVDFGGGGFMSGGGGGFLYGGGAIFVGGGSGFGGGGGGGGPAAPGAGGVEEVPPAAAVPEPRTWATLLLGFGMVGMILRRRRTLATKAAGAHA